MQSHHKDSNLDYSNTIEIKHAQWQIESFYLELILAVIFVKTFFCFALRANLKKKTCDWPIGQNKAVSGNSYLLLLYSERLHGKSLTQMPKEEHSCYKRLFSLTLSSIVH